MLIVNPNFTTDRTVRLAVLAPGSVQRTRRAIVTLGGKGVNVARIGRAFDHPATLVGFLPGQSRPLLTQLAEAEDADLHGTPVAGIVRASTILIEDSGRVSVLNEPGPEVTDADWDLLLAEIGRLAPHHRTAVCSGSLPPGSGDDAYARVVATVRDYGLRSVVDATGPVLAAALAAGPDVVSPNLAEAETLVHGPALEGVEPSGGDAADRAAEAAAGLVRQGAKGAVVSAGRFGAAWSTQGRTGFCPAPAVRVVNPIGAGDSLVGGLVHALEGGQAFPDAVRFAVAVASASCEEERAAAIDLRRLAELVGGAAGT